MKRVSQNWATLDVAFFGTSCSELQKFGVETIAQLTNQFKMRWVDQDHDALKNPDSSPSPIAIAKQFHPNEWQWTDHATPDGVLDQKSHQFDLALINGNHFQCEVEWLVFDPDRLEKVMKKPDRLTKCAGVIHQPEHKEEVERHFPHLPHYLISEFPKILKELAEANKAIAPVKGLILSGGKSTRMGHDKSLIKYHGTTQVEHLTRLCNEMGIEAHHSVVESKGLENEIKDRIVGMGPFGGICSAFMHDPNAAWLVLACDLPHVDIETIKALLNGRKTSKVATAFFNQETNWPDPLITIYEPKAYPRFLEMMSRGYSCPRKVLIHSEIELLNPTNPDWLRNANTPEEKDLIQAQLQG
ncbi:MAG: NTP transferase domain-containing protein [Flavobacteriales bacterium]|nr:NTP transferase domain-containing protein [Flavobacteriales bacterium]